MSYHSFATFAGKRRVSSRGSNSSSSLDGTVGISMNSPRTKSNASFLQFLQFWQLQIENAQCVQPPSHSHFKINNISFILIREVEFLNSVSCRGTLEIANRSIRDFASSSIFEDDRDHAVIAMEWMKRPLYVSRGEGVVTAFFLGLVFLF